MNKKLRALLDSINAKKQEVQDLAEADKLTEAQTAKDELQQLQQKFDLLADVMDAHKDNVGAEPHQVIDQQEFTPKQCRSAFAALIKAQFAAKRKGGDPEDYLSDQEKQIVNKMTEGTDANGGLTVPQDLQTAIKELKRGLIALEEHVNVENTTVNKGRRVIEKDAAITAWPAVDEAADFTEGDTPTLLAVDYSIKKYGDIMKLTNDLLADTAENLLAFLTKYCAKKSTATRNAKILAAFDAAAGESPVTIADVDGLKDVFNVTLDPEVALSAEVFTNQDGFNFMDKLKDKDGRYILQPNPMDKTSRLLFGAYPVTVLSNKALKTDTAKGAPIYMGDGHEAVTLFDREKMTIEANPNVYWTSDTMGCKVRDRFDVQVVDGAAMAKGFLKAAAG